MLLKYITSTHEKNRNIEIPFGDNLEKILKLINRYLTNKKKSKFKQTETFSGMIESNAAKLVENIFTDKAFADVENLK